MSDIQITEEQKIRARNLHEMLDTYNQMAPSETEEAEVDSGSSDMPMAMFVLQGRFGQGMALIEHSLMDADTVAKFATSVDPKDNKLWLYVETQNGLRVKMDALSMSTGFDEPVYVNIYDICHSVRKLMNGSETRVALWVSEGKLYMGAFYNDDIGGFELEIGFNTCEPFEAAKSNDDDYNVRIAMDQISFTTILDSVYDFETVEIHRKNGRISYRTGNDRCTIATVLQNSISITDNSENAKKYDTESDFSISIPAKIFKAIPLVNALDLDLSLNVLVDIDTVNKKIRITGMFATLEAQCGESTLQTYNNDGMERVFHIKSDAISAAIGMYFDINYLNPTGLARIYAIEDGLIGIEGMNDERIQVNLTVGDCQVEKPGFDIQLPLDVFTMMVRKSSCPDLVLQHNFTNNRTMMTYGNGMFLRKCTYIGE